MSVRAAISRAIALLPILLLAAQGALAEGPRSDDHAGRASSKASATDQPGPYSKVCGLRGKDLGKLVEQGPGKWKLYDTAPGSTAPRAFHLTGFSDGCPRRVLGAVAMFGSVDLYELLHYGPVGVKLPVTATDRAYAQMRARACGSARPCKGRGLQKLSRSAAFVNVYPGKGSDRRLEMLMNGGRVAAVAMK